jgi:hypothetical protein
VFLFLRRKHSACHMGEEGKGEERGTRKDMQD